MTVKEALLKVMGTFEGVTVTSCYEYDSMFVVQLAPPTSKNPSRLLTGLTSINKKTGVVRAFRPFDISVEEYQRGKEIPVSVYGGT